MPSPNLRFYACSIHNFAAACLALRTVRAALATEGCPVDTLKVVLTDTGGALSAVLDNARPLLGDAVKAGFVSVDDLPAELANIVGGLRAAGQFAPGYAESLVREITQEMAALRTFLAEGRAEDQGDSVPSLSEAKGVLDRIAKGAGA